MLPTSRHGDKALLIMFRKYVNNTVLLNVTYEQRRWYYYHTLTLCLTPVTTKITNTTIFRATQRCYQYRITPSNLKWRVSQCYVSSVAASGVFDTSTNISLDTWYKYVDQIPIHEILPIGLRSSLTTEITTAITSTTITTLTPAENFGQHSGRDGRGAQASCDCGTHPTGIVILIEG